MSKLVRRRRSRDGQRLLVEYNGYRGLSVLPGKIPELWRTLGFEACLGMICSFWFRLAYLQLRFLFYVSLSTRSAARIGQVPENPSSSLVSFLRLNPFCLEVLEVIQPASRRVVSSGDMNVGLTRDGESRTSESLISLGARRALRNRPPDILVTARN